MVGVGRGVSVGVEVLVGLGVSVAAGMGLLEGLGVGVSVGVGVGVVLRSPDISVDVGVTCATDKSGVSFQHLPTVMPMSVSTTAPPR